MDKSATKIYDKFEFWSVKDCSCELCLHYQGKGKPCPLEVCCIVDIRQEAGRREQTKAAAVPEGVMLSVGS